MIKVAEYIVISFKEGTYPLSENDFEIEIEKIKNSNDWETEFEKDGFYIFRENNFFIF